MNDSASNCTVIDEHLTQIVFPILYGIVFIVSVTLNSLAAWIFVNIKSHRSFIVYLKNLVLADLLMTLTIPFQILSNSELWPELKPFVCRYSGVMFYMSMYASIIFLSLISLDRHLKIVKPFGDSKMHRLGYARVISAGAWLFILALMMPNIILTNQKPTKGKEDNCTALKSPLGQAWHVAVNYTTIAIFIGGLVILIVCYVSISKEIAKSNKSFKPSSQDQGKKSQQNILSIVAVFFICFVPYHLFKIPFTASQFGLIPSCAIQKVLLVGKVSTLFLSACNGCLDPIIYFFMCKSFQELLFRKLNIETTIVGIQFLNQSKRSQVRQFCESTA